VSSDSTLSFNDINRSQLPIFSHFMHAHKQKTQTTQLQTPREIDLIPCIHPVALDHSQHTKAHWHLLWA